MIDVSLGSRKTAPSVIHTVARTSWRVSCGFVCSCRFPLLVMINGCLCKFAWWLIYYCANLCWLLWTQVHGSVVRAVDCRSAGPWFDSGWRSWFTFKACSDNPMNQISQMFISKSPITRKSVKMVADLDNGTAQWIFDNPRLDTVFGECNMTGEQQAAAPTVSAAQAPPFTAEQQGFSRGVHDGPAS